MCTEILAQRSRLLRSQFLSRLTAERETSIRTGGVAARSADLRSKGDLAQSLARMLGRVARRRDGAATVEFALVAVPFMMLIFCIIELSLILVVDLSLTNATLLLARQIRVGSLIAVSSSISASSGTTISLADFKQAICSNILIVPTATCLNSLQIDLRTQSAFAGQTNPNPVSGTNFSNTALCFYSGISGSIVELRAFYLWPLLNPVLLAPFVQTTTITTSSGTTSGSYFLLFSSEVFRNEPNASSSNSGTGC